MCKGGHGACGSIEYLDTDGHIQSRRGKCRDTAHSGSWRCFSIVLLDVNPARSNGGFIFHSTMRHERSHIDGMEVYEPILSGLLSFVIQIFEACSDVAEFEVRSWLLLQVAITHIRHHRAVIYFHVRMPHYFNDIFPFGW